MLFGNLTVGCACVLITTFVLSGDPPLITTAVLQCYRDLCELILQDRRLIAINQHREISVRVECQRVVDTHRTVSRILDILSCSKQPVS